MQARITDYSLPFSVDLSKPIDISIPMTSGGRNPNAFYAPNPNIEPVRTDAFIGSTKEGGVVNFKNIFLNPHGNGTHTECVGHISSEPYTIHDCLKQFHFLAALVTIEPMKDQGDYVVLKEQIESSWHFRMEPEVLIIRTKPNTSDKLCRKWSGTNPPYIHHEAIAFLVEKGIQHLLVDLPSVDREEDGGKLMAHKAFWNYPSNHVRSKSTITEMIHVPDTITDGMYFTNIQIMSLQTDASPSKVLLYSISEE